MDQLSRLSTSAAVQAALNSLPRGIYETYSRILNSIPVENEIHAMRTLTWLSYAAAPLTLPELVEAIVVDEDSSSLGDLQRFFDSEDIFQICGSLVRRSDLTGELSLAHSSVYEFLTTTNPQSRPPTPYHVPAAQSAVALTKTCLTYLSFQDFNMVQMQATVDPNLSVVSSTDTAGFDPSTDRPFFGCALRHWWKHLPCSEEGIGEIWPNLVQFFNRETGNFGSILMLLRHLEGIYRYPMTTQPIHFCAIHGLCLVSHRLLTNALADVDCKVEDGRRALHMAAENGHADMVRHLSKFHTSLDDKTSDGRTPLQFAMESGNEYISNILIGEGADVNAHFSNNETALSVAVGNGWHSLVRALLRGGADTNGRLSGGRTSLHVAAEVGSDCGMMSILFQAGADQTLRDDNSWTGLHLAAHHGHREVVIVFIENSTARKIFERVEWTPLHAAIEQEHIAIVRLFGEFAHAVSTLFTKSKVRQQRIVPSSSNPRPASSKGRRGAPEAVSGEASRSGGTVLPPLQPAQSSTSLKEEQIPSPLFLATSQSYLKGVVALMEAGANSEDVRACIQYAFTKEKGDIVKCLVHGSEQHFKFLLSLGGSSNVGPSIKTLEHILNSTIWDVNDLQTAMKEAILRNNHALLGILIEQLLQVEDESGHDAQDWLADVLRVGVQSKDVEAVQLLVVAGADLSSRIEAILGRYEPDTVSCSLLHLAAHLGDSDMVSYLLSNSLSPDLRDSKGRTPLHYAIQPLSGEDVTTTLRLLSSEASVSASDNEGWTPLHLASHYDCSGSIPSLLHAGARINAFDKSGLTPLHHCVFAFPHSRKFPTAAMLLLLDSGASASELTKDGYNPMQLALVRAIKTKDPNCVSMVLDQQTDLISTRIPPLQWTPLHFAAEADSGSPILEVLFSRKPDLEAEDTQGRTPQEVAGPIASRLLVNRGARWRK